MLPSPFRLSFRVEGQAIPKQSFRIGKGGRHYQPAEVKAFRDLVSARANEAMKLAGWGEPYPNAVSVNLKFDKARGDADNMAKAILDGMNKLVWKDDKQVLELHVYLDRDAEHAGTFVSVEAL